MTLQDVTFVMSVVAGIAVVLSFVLAAIVWRMYEDLRDIEIVGVDDMEAVLQRFADRFEDQPVQPTQPPPGKPVRDPEADQW